LALTGSILTFGRGRSRRPSGTALAVRATALLAGLALLSGCSLLGGSSGQSEGDGKVEKPRIKVAVMTTIDLAPFHLAMQNGYFKEQGLDVEPVTAPSGQATLSKLIGGDVDIAISSYQPFFLAKAKGAADVQFVADGSSSPPKSTMVIAGPSSPVRNVRDLAGKRIGITGPGTASQVMTMAAMKNNGVDFNKVQWVTMPFPDMGQALARGDLDAAYVPEPFVTQTAKTVGAVPVVDPSAGPTDDFPTTGYASKPQLVSQSPKTVLAFQRAMARATAESADRSKIEPLLVKFSKVDPGTASMTTLMNFRSTVDPKQLQRVPDLLLEFGVINQPVDAAAMVARPQAS
jgi:NitT/TauT family transport system substrate-binding protein